MLASIQGSRIALRVAEVDVRTPPAWVGQLLGTDPETFAERLDGDLRWRIADSDDYSFLQVTLAGAAGLSACSFRRRVTEIYGRLRDLLDRRRSRHPIRFWNFIPGIGERIEEDLVRYEVFNAGRFLAFSDWYRTPRFGPHMVAASGVGHQGSDFVVQVLAAERPGRGLENPRQRPAYRYSERYGPLPPCFARATLAAAADNGSGQGLLVIAGTASIVGEDSRHLRDLPSQVAETCANLECLIGQTDPPGERGAEQPLDRLRELRAYVPGRVAESSGLDAVTELLGARFTNLERLELAAADLCRPELLIEVEGAVEADLCRQGRSPRPLDAVPTVP